MPALYRKSGFTLVELVAVIVILAVVSTMGASFVARAQQAYHETQLRAKLINKSRQAVERMTRQLRGAVPFSWRLVNSAAGGACIEYLPIAAGGNYLAQVPDLQNGAAASATIATAPFTLDFGTGRMAIVGAMASGEIYGAGISRANLAAPIAVPGPHNLLTFALAKQWQRNSINQRFYVADNPQAFCLDGASLNFYDNQNVAGAGVTGTAAELLALDVSTAGAAFAISGGTEDRNILLTIDLTFSEDTESVAFQQGVSLRNVP